MVRHRFWLVGVSLSALAAVAVIGPRALMAQTPRPGVRAPEAGRFIFGQGSYIGAALDEVSEEAAKKLKLTRPEGALVLSVQPNSPASSAGLQTNDVVIQFDQERVRSARELTRLVAETPAGRRVTLSVMRNGNRSDLAIVPASAPGIIDSERVKELADQAGRLGRDLALNLPGLPAFPGRGRLGVTAQDLTPELAAYFGVKSGVLVASVAAASPAAAAGLRAGDVITSVDGRSVSSAAELIRALPAGDNREVSLTLVREKKEMTVRATLGTERQAVAGGVPAD
jgi:S1-C subfamily serine protease